jgi:peptide/nickel transport system substrate-binding protein
MQTTAASSVLGLAGCSGQEGGNEDTPTPTSTATGGSDNDDETDNPKLGGHLKVAQAGQPPDWDPILGLGVPSAIVGSNFFSVLFTYDNDLQLVSDDLTTGLPETERDGQRYIVELVDDAEWHNGDPVTAEDVQYSFLQPREEGSWKASSWSMLDSTEIIDEQTIQFNLDYPYGAFSSALASMEIVPKDVREEDPEAFAQNPVGSGPFKLDDWAENEFATVVRWDDYWGDRDPYVDKVTFSPVTENTTRITEFKQNSHIMQDIPPKLFSSVRNIEDAQIRQKPSLSYTYTGFNLNEGETTKPKVREAIDYCFDMDEVVEQFVEPAGVRQYQPIPIPTAKAWDMPIDEFKAMAVGKDIDTASSLFDEANVPADWECTMLAPPDDVRENMMVTIANGIKEAGYNASVTRLDWGTFLEDAYTGKAEDYNMYTLGWSVSPDPDYQMYNMYHESGAGANHGHYWSDDEVMETIEEARRTPDYEKRRELYIEIQKEVIGQRVQIPGWNPKAVWATKDTVNDFFLHPIPSENPRIATQWNNIWLDE